MKNFRVNAAKLGLTLMLLAVPAMGQISPPSGGGSGSSPAATLLASISKPNLTGLYLFDAADYAGGTGTVLHDHSGAGHDCTIPIAAAANSPTWVVRPDGGYAIYVHPNSPDTLAQDMVVCPITTVQAFDIVRLSDLAPGSFGTIIGSLDATNYGSQLIKEVSGASSALYNQYVQGFSTPVGGVYNLYGVTNSATVPYAYYNGIQQFPGGSPAAGPGLFGTVTQISIGGTNGTSCGGAGVPFCTWPGKVAYLAVYSAALTQFQMVQNQTAELAYFKAQGLDLANLVSNTTSAQYNVTCNGNSIYAGANLNPATTPCSSLGLPANYVVNNTSLFGMNAAIFIQSKFAAANRYFSPTSQNILILADASNDLCNASPPFTATQLGGVYASGVALAKAQGYSTVIIPTMLSRTGCDPQKNAIDLVLRQQAARMGASLLDMAAIPQLGADGAYSNLTYFSDATHPTNAGDVLMQGAIARVILANTGSTAAAPTVSVATALTLTADVRFLNWTPTAAATGTLPECLGLTGYDYQIRNLSAFAITMSGAGTETISGSATVAANTPAQFTVQLTSPTAGGCYWQRTQ